jgi:hypothetical protein
MSTTPLPASLDHRDESLGGGMIRGAVWLANEVGEGNIFTKEQLRKAIPGHSQIDRRVRNLRDWGWQIDDSKQDASLKQEQQRLVRIGVAVWDKAEYRANRPPAISDRVRQEVFARDSHRCVRCGAPAGEEFVDKPGRFVALTAAHVYPASLGSKATAHDLVTTCQRCNEPLKQHTANYLDVEQVWQRVRDSGMKDKQVLLRWITADRRDVSNLEALFGHFRQLPGAERDLIAQRLRSLVERAD